MQGHAVACLESAEVAQQRRELVDADEQLLIGQVLYRLVLRFGHEMDRGLVLVFDEVAIDAVVAGVDPAADEPAPERRVAGVERRLPVLVPVEKVRELLKALGEFVKGKALEDAGVGQVGLRDESAGRRDVVLFRPMHRDLCLGDIDSLLLRGMARRPVFSHDDHSFFGQIEFQTETTTPLYPCLSTRRFWPSLWLDASPAEKEDQS